MAFEERLSSFSMISSIASKAVLREGVDQHLYAFETDRIYKAAISVVLSCTHVRKGS